MSINSLLTNETILDDLTAIIDAKSGNVASVSGTAPIAVSPTAGACVVSLIQGPYFTTGPSNDLSLNISNTGASNGFLLSKGSANTLTWVPDVASSYSRGVLLNQSTVSVPFNTPYYSNTYTINALAGTIMTATLMATFTIAQGIGNVLSALITMAYADNGGAFGPIQPETYTITQTGVGSSVQQTTIILISSQTAVIGNNQNWAFYIAEQGLSAGTISLDNWTFNINYS